MAAIWTWSPAMESPMTLPLADACEMVAKMEKRKPVRADATTEVETFPIRSAGERLGANLGGQHPANPVPDAVITELLSGSDAIVRSAQI
ncbi:hypothetical protein T07_11033 [Trichinella nelsoni]|uniref:Uncharacterized protein n=1 Tax=Trichinella nelsoni TaxID=6336 RepID=A0A0V0RVG0_9BILA|nr:hypothetical protein T07_11033 [Trichinella nelsoni]